MVEYTQKVERMSVRTLEERIISMQVDMVSILMKRWKVDNRSFVDLDLKYGILDYIRLCYEPFHLTGELGIAEEIESWMKEQGAALNTF